MKHRWTTLLWELWAAQALCAVAALPPGSAFHTCPALALPGLALALQLFLKQKGLFSL